MKRLVPLLMLLLLVPSSIRADEVDELIEEIARLMKRG
jgi:hypothetical protein